MRKIIFGCVLPSLLLAFCPGICHAQWATVHGPQGGPDNAFLINGDNLFVATAVGGLFRSQNDGTSWSPVQNGLTATWVSSFAIFGGTLFAGTMGSGVFHSSDGGASWTEVNKGLAEMNIVAMAVSGHRQRNFLGGGQYWITEPLSLRVGRNRQLSVRGDQQRHIPLRR